MNRKITTIFIILIIPSICISQALWNSYTPLNINIYNNILNDLKDKGYSFVLPKDFKYNKNIKTVIIYHDCDFNMDGLEKFYEVEDKLNIKSCFFIRPDMSFTQQNIIRLKTLENNGWEVGYHYDVLSRANNNYELALINFIAQLNYLRIFFNISSSRCHGDEYNLNIDNSKLFDRYTDISITYNIKDFSILPYNITYIKDTQKRLVIPNSNEWKNLTVILFHTDWW